jgi:hypothetical protein
VSLPSQPQWPPLLGLDKRKYALMPSYTCLEDEQPGPARLLLLPPRPNGARRLVVALGNAMASPAGWLRSLL